MNRISLDAADGLNAGARRNIGLLLLFRPLLCSFSFCVPVIVPIWKGDGLAMSQILMLQALFALGTIVPEVATSYIGDLRGRKWSLVAAGALVAMGSGLYCLARSQLGYLAAELALGFGFACASGVDQAILFDSLVQLGRQQEFKRYWRRSTVLMLIFGAASASLSGWLAEINLRLPLIVAFGFSLGLIPVSLLLIEPAAREEDAAERAQSRGALSTTAKLGYTCFVQDARLRWLLLFPALLLAFNQVGCWFYQPYFELSGLPLAASGWIFALFQIVAAVGIWRSGLVEERVGERGVALLLMLMISLSYLLMGSFVVRLGFNFALLQQLVRGFGNVFDAYLNEQIDSGWRATIISIKSIVNSAIYAALLMIISLSVDGTELPTTLQEIGFGTIGSGLLCYLLLFRPAGRAA